MQAREVAEQLSLLGFSLANPLWLRLGLEIITHRCVECRSRVAALEQRTATAEAELQRSRGDGSSLRLALSAWSSTYSALEPGLREQAQELQRMVSTVKYVCVRHLW